MITDVEGVRVGHWTDHDARTGCTVVLLPEGTVASGEVRGGAPATREFALLEPHRLVERVDAVVLSGGSAFGLAAADGVMHWLEEHDVGLPTSAGPVPIVVAMSLFDLLVGDARARPGSDEGYGACTTASGGPIEVGSVGAGAGATVDKWRGIEHRRPGGIGTATRRWSEVVVSALVAVNAYGGVATSPGPVEDEEPLPDVLYAPFTNTIIGLVATNAVLDKTSCHLVAQSGHDGIARAVFPPHTRYDGDALVAAATGQIAAGVEVVRVLAVRAVEAAIRRAVADPGGGGVARQ